MCSRAHPCPSLQIPTSVPATQARREDPRVKSSCWPATTLTGEYLICDFYSAFGSFWNPPSSGCYITQASSQMQSSLQKELHSLLSSKTLLREIIICRALQYVYLQSQLPTLLHSKNASQNGWVEIEHVEQRSKLPLPCGNIVLRSELCLWTKRACILLKFPHPHGKFYFLLNSVVKIGSKEICRPKHCLDNIKGHVASKALSAF